jgi:serine/threonine protein kinase
MSTPYKRRKGEVFSDWKLDEPLGKGGNAEVWRALHQDGTTGALKVLNSRNPNSEPYKRFRAEINLLRSFGQRAGVLPLIDASLPEQPGNQNPAWFVMPIATGISEALGQQPSLPVVVGAIATIAETLASLAAEGISHRDIKPGNLYQFEEQWAIGDFGLAEYPDKEELTEEGRTLGPRFYLAPEMIINPKNADGHKADVYSLAKTLWVLATGNIFPPQGEQRIDMRQINIGGYVPYPKTRSLDWLIEHATKHDPQDRPTMAEMAVELRAWLAPPAQPTSPADISDLAKRIATAVEPSRRQEEKRTEYQKEASTVFGQLFAAFRPIADGVSSAIRGAVLQEDQMIYNNFKIPCTMGSPDLIWNKAWSIVAVGPGVYPIHLHAGVGVEVFTDQTIHLIVGFMVGMERMRPRFVWHDSRKSRIGSSEQECIINELALGLTENLRRALEAFASLVESSTP